jgi:hypothetical protein
MGHTPSLYRPIGAAFWHRVNRIMEVILHLGAHRTATTSFQSYMKRNGDIWKTAHVGYSGPRRTGRGLHAAILSGRGHGWGDPVFQAALRRVKRQIDHARARGLKQLVVSDENMIGTVQNNMRAGQLYPDVAERLALFARAFEGQVATILFSPRSLGDYWCSALACSIGLGMDVPDRARLNDIAMSRRGWREVITDIAGAFPEAALRVLPFERHAGAPHLLLQEGAGIAAPQDKTRTRLNPCATLPELRRVLNERRAATTALPFGMGRWNPFTNEEHAALRELYADDMMWLVAGADGLATLTEDRSRNEAGKTLPPGTDRKGRCDELQQRKLARPG